MSIITALIAWALLLGFAAFGFRRGLSAVCCIGACVIVAAIMSAGLAYPLASYFPLGGRPETQASLGLWRLIFFGVLFVAAFPIGLWIARYFLWTFEPFDWALGAAMGLVIGCLVARFFLASMLLAAEGLPQHEAIDGLFLTRQFVHLDGWRGFLDWTYRVSHPKPLQVPED